MDTTVFLLVGVGFVLLATAVTGFLERWWSKRKAKESAKEKGNDGQWNVGWLAVEYKTLIKLIEELEATSMEEKKE